MGADVSTARMQTLTDMGFTVAESRLALEATNGDVARAADLLARRREARERASGGAVVRRINELLQEQRPWNEFFDRFMWPEHLSERVQTNLLYYRANYAIISAAITLLSVLQQPSLLIVTGICSAVFYGAVEWGDHRPIPGLDQALSLEQRVATAMLASAAVVNYSGSSGKVARVALLCGGLTLGHAAFRARTLAARWSFFKDQVEKQD